MKILFVSCESKNDLHYGLGKSTLALVEQLKNNNHSVRYFFQDDEFNQEVLALDYVESLLIRLCVFFPVFQNTLSVGLLRFKIGIKAALLAKREKYTHIHCSDPVIAFALYMTTLFIPTEESIRWGFSAHGFGAYVQNRVGIFLHPLLKYLLHQCEKQACLKADWVVIPSLLGRGQLKKDMNIKFIPPQWHVVYHARPILEKLTKKYARRLLGWKNNRIYIIAIGQLIPLKQFPILIEACSELPQNSYIQLIILGSGDHSSLQAHSQKTGLINPIYITETDDVSLYLSAADIYVSVSSTESFGMANLEAAISGLPVICSQVGAVPEIMASCALFFEPDKKSLKKALTTVLSSPDKMKEMSVKSLKMAEQWPDISTVTQQYETIFLERTIP